MIHHQEHDVTLHQGDASTVLASLPEQSVNCCVTSPPYFGLRDYGVDGQLGLEPSPAEYVAAMVDVFRGVRQVLHDDGVLWLNLGDSYANPSMGGTQGATGQRFGRTFTAAASGGYKGLPAKNLIGIPWRVAFALQDDGWTLRNAVIWHKSNAMPESVTDRLSTRYEHVFLFSKSRRYRFDLDPIREPHAEVSIRRAAAHRAQPGKSYRAGEMYGAMMPGQTLALDQLNHPAGRNPGDVWTIPTSPYPGAHFATMPPAVARRCILAGCPDGGTVLDPFTGSGTTGMVARQLGRRFVGIDLNPAYLDLAIQRIGDPVLDFGAAS